MHPHVPGKHRSEAIRILRGFVRGDVGADELEGFSRELGLSSAAELGEAVSLELEDLPGIDVRPRIVARQLGRHLAGTLDRSDLFRWVTHLHRIVTSRWYEPLAAPSPALGAALNLLSFLLDPGYPTGEETVRGPLGRIQACLDSNRPVPARTFLPGVFRRMGPLELCIIENPVSFSLDLRSQWVDVGLPSSNGEDIRLVPFSIFTRTFFQDRLPAMMSRLCGPGAEDWAGIDRFYYHPENDQAIPLKERHPALGRSAVEFQYFIDESGLAEIVLDAAAIRRREVLFAARLFCLQNGVRSATLNGRRVACAAAAV